MGMDLWRGVGGAMVIAAVLGGCTGEAAESPAAAEEAPAAEPQAVASHDAAGAPRYTADGQLVRPEGYHRWVFVGSNMALGYAPEAKATTAMESARNEPAPGEPFDFHNVYVDAAAYEHYLRTREFPDPTVLVMDKYDALDREPEGIVDRGWFDGPNDGIEVAVKNTQRPDGSTTPWAYYRFPLADGAMPASAPAQPDANCYDCHVVHASVDNVWVQFYPILRDLPAAP